MSGCAGVPNKVAGEATFLPSPHDGATVLHCVSARGRRTLLWRLMAVESQRSTVFPCNSKLSSSVTARRGYK